MAEQRFKRNVAYKFRIGDILIGKPVMNGDRFSFLELGNKKIIRVNVIGNIVDKYESGDERKYLFMTLDDGSGQIKLKTFGDDSDKFKKIYQGQTVLVIGFLRYWNDETYISPEIIGERDPKYLLLRKLETERDKALNARPVERGQIISVKDKILELIQSSEDNGGIEVDVIIL